MDEILEIAGAITAVFLGTIIIDWAVSSTFLGGVNPFNTPLANTAGGAAAASTSTAAANQGVSTVAIQ